MSTYSVDEATLLSLMKDKKIRKIKLSNDKKDITFSFYDRKNIVLRCEGDCCSDTWIEHLNILASELDSAIVIDIVGAEPEDLPMEEEVYTRKYQTIFRTDKGDICLEYRNASNGYYGGYLCLIKS